MFRFTIREMLLITVIVGLALGWWLDHRAYADVAEDARMLALHSAYPPTCGNAAVNFQRLQAKYGAGPLEWSHLLETDEPILALNVEP